MTNNSEARRRVVGYVRVSTSEQAESGVSLAAQRERLEAYATLYDLELVEVIEDAGASAKSLDRAGLKRALVLLRSGGADGLLVAKLDRLTRSVRDLDTLIHGDLRDRHLFSVAEQIDTSSAAGRLVLNVLASVSQWEREAIGERTSAALQHKRRNGEHTGGGAPFGYRVESGRLIEDAAEQRIRELVLELRTVGLSYRAISKALAERGITTRKGTTWDPQQVRRVCTFTTPAA